MKTIILDDDPTGTQSATGVTVLLEFSADLITEALCDADSVYVQTNSRSLSEAAAVELIRQIRMDSEEASRRLGAEVRFVLRGDSTLRGHVFAETEVFLDDGAVMLFVPAFPDGGRTTRDGVHYVRLHGVDIPAEQSEYANDPVFGFSTGVLVDYVKEKSGRHAISVPLSVVHSGGLTRILADSPAGSVVVPDAIDSLDLAVIAAAVEEATALGARIIVRSASPLAAELAGVASRGLLEGPLLARPEPVLLACGSHTLGATAQLAPVVSEWGDPAVINTEAALDAPAEAGLLAAADALAKLKTQPLAILTTERARSAAHNTLEHGEKVMTALTCAVRALLPEVSVVISKGGITSAEIARTGIGASSARVLGQILPGVSVWEMHAHDSRKILFVVVPGNVGEPDTLTRVLHALSFEPAPQREQPSSLSV